MKVLLRRTWFGPDGRRYRRLPGGVEVPNELKDQLPSSAVEITKKGEPKAKNVGGEPVALSQLGSQLNPPSDPQIPPRAEGGIAAHPPPGMSHEVTDDDRGASAEPRAGDNTTGSGTDFSTWSLADLRAEAAKRDIEGRSSMDKEALIKALS